MLRKTHLFLIPGRIVGLGWALNEHRGGGRLAAGGVLIGWWSLGGAERVFARFGCGRIGFGLTEQEL
ncbi:MAG: hypothetical protein ACYDEW_05085, partial [Vulcanimicrobiaceae bacterium]